VPICEGWIKSMGLELIDRTERVLGVNIMFLG
jgi:hypothetical protein